MSENYTTELPENYDGLMVVDNLDGLFAAVAGELSEAVNVVLCPQALQLKGDFNGLAEFLFQQRCREIFTMEHKKFSDFFESRIKGNEPESVVEAAASLAEGLQVLREKFHNRAFSGGQIKALSGMGYAQSKDGDDIEGYHSDRYPWRLLFCMTEPTTRWVRNQDTVYHPGTRKVELLEGAKEYDFKPGDVWIHAGIESRRRNPFLHKGVRPDPDKYRLLYA